MVTYVSELYMVSCQILKIQDLAFQILIFGASLLSHPFYFSAVSEPAELSCTWGVAKSLKFKIWLAKY